MGPKKGNDSSKVKRKNTNVMIDVKKEIITKHGNGVRVSDLATQFGMAKSTICTILKNRETMKKANVARGVTVITKQRSQTIEEVEKLQLIWINDNDNAMCHFRIILKRRQKQITLNNFVVRQRASGSEAESSGAKRQKKEKESPSKQ
jgi:hypothetical protein